MLFLVGASPGAGAPLSSFAHKARKESRAPTPPEQFAKRSIPFPGSHPDVGSCQGPMRHCLAPDASKVARRVRGRGESFSPWTYSKNVCEQDTDTGRKCPSVLATVNPGENLGDGDAWKCITSALWMAG